MSAGIQPDSVKEINLPLGAKSRAKPTRDRSEAGVWGYH